MCACTPECVPMHMLACRLCASVEAGRAVAAGESRAVGRWPRIPLAALPTQVRGMSQAIVGGARIGPAGGVAEVRARVCVCVCVCVRARVCACAVKARPARCWHRSAVEPLPCARLGLGGTLSC